MFYEQDGEGQEDAEQDGENGNSDCTYNCMAVWVTDSFGSQYVHGRRRDCFGMSTVSPCHGSIRGRFRVGPLSFAASASAKRGGP